MKVSCEILNYQKNLRCLRDVTDKLLSYMKGHDYSFRPEITDNRGNLDRKKLRALVEELLFGWEASMRDGVYPDRPGGESPADPYLRARRELYGLYLYLAMWCSLCEGAFAATRDRENLRERTDFAFLLEQARRFSRSWCVMAGPDGTRRNEPYEGFDAYFGFHLFRPLTDPEGRGRDSALTPDWRAPAQAMRRDASLTDEGAVKRVALKRLSPPPFLAEAAEDLDAEDAEAWEDWENIADDSGDSPDADGWEMTEPPDSTFWECELERQWEEDNRSLHLAGLAARFDGREEYIKACRRFAVLYRQAPAEVLRGFDEELEEIINLFLLRHGQTILTDTDKTLDVYSRIYDGPCRQARRYASGLQWKSL